MAFDLDLSGKRALVTGSEHVIDGGTVPVA